MSSQSALYRQKNQDTLQLIKNLSEAEEELTRKLAYTNNKKNRRNLENSIRTISETKENLVTALGSLSKYYTSNLENASRTLDQQSEAVAIIDREMQIAKKRLEYVNSQKANKMRKVEINQYYAANYQEKTLLLKWILLLIAVLVVFYYVKSIFDMVPPLIYALILTVILVFFGYKMLKIFLSLNARSKMVYDEYSWKFDTENAPAWDPDSKSMDPFRLPPSTCIGEGCCSEGIFYDKELGVCVPSVSTLTSKCSAADVRGDDEEDSDFSKQVQSFLS